MSWIKSTLRTTLAMLLVLASLLVGMEAAGRYLFGKLMETPAYSVARHACFESFFGEKAARQREIVRDNAMVLQEFKEGRVFLRDAYTPRHRVVAGRRVTCGEGAGKHVYFVGGSTMEGIGTDDCETIPSWFQKENPRVVAVNLGIRGFDSTMERRYVESLGLEKGATVVFLDGVNDTYYDVDAAHFAPVQPFKHRMIKYVLNHTLMRSYFVNWYMSVLKKKPENKTTDLADGGACSPRAGKDIVVTAPLTRTMDDAVATYVDNNKALRALCKERGLSCFFFLQPMPSYRYPHDLYFTDSRGGFSTLQQRYGEFVRRVAATKLAVDVSGVLEKLPRAYVDKLHYSSEANRLISDAIAAEILGKR